MNSMLSVQDGVLYIYGGSWETGKREWTGTDLYKLPLAEGTKWQPCIEMDKSSQAWLGEAEDESDDEDDDDQGDEEDEDEEEEDMCFGDHLDPPMVVPERLAKKDRDSVIRMNKYHFAMVNDTLSTKAYHAALQKVIKADSVVLQLGVGSGVLAMMAAKLGAKKVICLEISSDIADIAEQIVASAGLQEKVVIYNLGLADVGVGSLPERPNVLVADMFGPTLLSEGVLKQVADARTRLLAPKSTTVPAVGMQYATLIESEQLMQISAVSDIEGFQLDRFNQMQNTACPIFTKDMGFRFSDVVHTKLAPPVAVSQVAFQTDDPSTMARESRHRLQVTASGTVHAVLLHWEVFADAERTRSISNDPDPAKGHFTRDVRWGQAYQLIEHTDSGDVPMPVVVKDGDCVELVVRHSADLKHMQVSVEKL